MTIPSTEVRIQYAGSGTTGPFAIPFYFAQNSHILAVKTATDGTETTLVLTTDYSLTGAGDPPSGALTLVSALASGETLTIESNVPFTQEVDLTQNDALPAETLEDALDKATILLKQLSAQLSRAAKLSVGSSGISADLPAPEALALLGWNADGDGLANFANVDLEGVVITTFMLNLLQNGTSAAATRSQLGLTSTATTTSSAWGRAWIALADAAAGRTDLGLGTLATVSPSGTANNTTFLNGAGAYTNELGGFRVGYMDVNWTTQNATYGFVLTDRGVGIRKTDNSAYTWTIPANASVAFPVGTVISIANLGGAGNITVAITSDTLQLAGGTTTGSRTFAPGAFGGIVKVNTTHWLAFGAGVT